MESACRRPLILTLATAGKDFPIDSLQYQKVYSLEMSWMAMMATGTLLAVTVGKLRHWPYLSQAIHLEGELEGTKFKVKGSKTSDVTLLKEKLVNLTKSSVIRSLIYHTTRH